uniref:Uncharacterized protein n=1 Tax=Peronospora matthiolae TaxID=2874970 RepID=A0AAV1UPX6_9STRA
MQTKMEVLSHPVKADCRRSVRVIADSSMTMRFSLPTSYRPQTLSPASEPKGNESVERTVGDDDESWEDRDWMTEVPSRSCLKSNDKVDEVDEWEHQPQTSPDLPDDFPRLLVNLTRVQRQYFAATKREEDDAFDFLDVFYRVKNTLHEQCTPFVEVLFEHHWGFHCTYGMSRALLDGLHTAFPTDVLALVDYPPAIDGVPLHEFLYTLSSPSRWKSVEYLRTCLCRCSRDMRWKCDVMRELELLAETEAAQYETRQQQQSDEIEELTRLRDSFRAKLETIVPSRERKLRPGRQQYVLILRKLEDVENRLMTLLDAFLKEPELDEEEYRSAFDSPGGEGGVAVGTNVLDMVIAMVFGRLPRDFSQQTTTEEHFRMLFDHHIQILRLWKKDFGRLPLQSRVAAHDEGARGSDAGRTFGSLREERAVLDVSDGESVAELTEECLVKDGAVGNLDGASLRCDVTSEDIGQSCEGANDSKTLFNDDSDGYGADSDSDASEDDVGEVTVAQIQRHQLKRVPPKLGEAETGCRLDGPRRRRMKHPRRATKLHKSKADRCESDAERQAASFQPFACTGAVKLLRQAKEKELF